MKNAHTGISIKELYSEACEHDKQIEAYLGHNWSLEGNRKLQTIVDLLQNHNDIKLIKMKPQVFNGPTKQLMGVYHRIVSLEVV